MKIVNLLLFIIFVTNSNAEFTFNENCKKAYTHIFNLEKDEANYLIKVEELYNPSNPSVIFLKSGMMFMEGVLKEDIAATTQFFELHDDFLNKAENEITEDDNINWLIVESYFHAALLNFKNGNYIKGAWQLHKSYKIAERYEDKNILSFKITGLTESFLGTVPDEYQWVLKIFGMNGDLTSGKNKLYKLLNEASKNPDLKFILPEMVFYTAYVEGNLLNNKNTALNIINSHQEATGIFTDYIHSSLLMKSGNSDEAKKILERSFIKYENTDHPFPYMNYMLGMVKLQNFDYNSKKLFNNYLERYKGNHYKKSAMQKLAWIALLKNNSKEYYEKIQEVKLIGNEETDEDRQAMIEANNNEAPDINLLKSRLLSDGGKYTSAEKILEEMNPKNLNTKNFVEYHYRYGRIKQEQKDYDLTEFYFIKTISLQGEQNFYFAPNAALQIAMIAEENKDINKSEEYYKKAYSYKKHEYKNSIQQKAKAGLERIKKLKSQSEG